jgi:hypothetical protein
MNAPNNVGATVAPVAAVLMLMIELPPVPTYAAALLLSGES